MVSWNRGNVNEEEKEIMNRGLFGFGKKKEEKPACRGNGCNIKVLGAGCKSGHEQYENVK